MCCAARWKYRTQKIAKSRHLGTIAQLCRAISSQLRHISTIEKKLVKHQCLPHVSSQYDELRPTSGSSGWDLLAGFRLPCKFQRVSRLGSVTARHSSQTLRRWTQGATYIRQGGNHVGHRPTFYFVCILKDFRDTTESLYDIVKRQFSLPFSGPMWTEPRVTGLQITVVGCLMVVSAILIQVCQTDGQTRFDNMWCTRHMRRTVKQERSAVAEMGDRWPQ